MFTMEQIEKWHERLASVGTFSDYVQWLAGLGVVRYDSVVSDGHSEYFGLDDHRVVSRPAHEEFVVADRTDRAALVDHLRRHERGESSYLEMSRGMAACGVERWTVDTRAVTMTFFAPSGDVLVVEQIT